MDDQIRLTTFLEPDDEALQYILGVLRNSRDWLVFSLVDGNQNRVVMSIDAKFKLYHMKLGDSHIIDYELITRWVQSRRFEKWLVIIKPRWDV